MSETATADTTLGHNNPPPDVKDVYNSLPDQLQVLTADLLTREEEIVASAGRAPASIDNDETAQKVTSFLGICAAFRKEAEARRKDTKQPWIDGGNVVQGHFKGLVARVTDAEATFKKRLGAYTTAKQEAERKALAEAEAKRRKAAEAAARMAETPEDAEAVAEMKAKAAEAEEARIAALKQSASSRSDTGALATSRKVWVGEVMDRDTLDLEKLRPYIPKDALEKALRAYVKAGGRALKGAEIREDTQTTVRT